MPETEKAPDASVKAGLTPAGVGVRTMVAPGIGRLSLTSVTRPFRTPGGGVIDNEGLKIRTPPGARLPMKRAPKYPVLGPPVAATVTVPGFTFDILYVPSAAVNVCQNPVPVTWISTPPKGALATASHTVPSTEEDIGATDSPIFPTLLTIQI